MKFKVGDKVKFVGDYRRHSTYNGKKLEDFIKENKNILYVSTVNTSYTQVKGSTFWCFYDGELELTEYTYEDLKKSPIGTKVTFEDGVLIKVAENYYKEDYQDGRFRNNKDLKGLKDNFGVFNLGKIIKIEEPTYQTVYEYKPEILDETEKRYLKGVIRPFRNNVEIIRRMYSRTKNKDYIQIRYKNDTPTNLPYFEKDTMYKGMELDKIYTLEELGL